MSDEAIGVLMPKILEAARLSRYCPGFSGATLAGCALDANGNVILGVVEGASVDQDSGINNKYIFTGANDIGQRLQTGFDKKTRIFKESVYVSGKSGTPGNISCEIYNVTTSTSLGKITKTAAEITASAYNEFDFTSFNCVYTATDVIDIRVEGTGSDASNSYTITFSASDVQADAVMLTDSWAESAGNDLKHKTIFGEPALSGTSTEDIAVSSLAEWYKYYRTVTTPANTSVTCAIKDTSNNVLVASVADGDSLSAIDETTYKTIRLVHTLARDSVSDATPKLYYREVSWIGNRLLSAKSIKLNGTQTSYATVINVTGRGELRAITQFVAASRIGHIKITIDGVLFFDSVVDNAGNGFVNGTKFSCATIIKEFYASLKVEHKVDSSAAITTIVSYGLEE